MNPNYFTISQKNSNVYLIVIQFDTNIFEKVRKCLSNLPYLYFIDNYENNDVIRSGYPLFPVKFPLLRPILIG